MRLRLWSRGGTARAASLALGAALADVAGLVSLVPLVALVLGGHDGRIAGAFIRFATWLGITADGPRIALAVLVFLAAMALRSTLAGWRDIATLRLQTGYAAHLQQAVMTGLAAAPWSRVETLRHARVTQALGPDAVRAASAAQLMLQIGGGVLVLVLQWLLALAIAPVLALAVVVVALLAATAFARSLLRTGSIGASLNARGLSLIHIAQQFLGGLKLAKAQNAERGFIRGFEQLSNHILDLRVNYQVRQIRNRQSITFAAAAAAALFLLVGRWAGLDSARLIASFAILTRISAAGTALVQQLQLVSSVLPSHTSLIALIDEFAAQAEPEALAPPVPASEPSSAELIRLEQVAYAPAGAVRLAEVSFTLAPGEIVALSGESGAGKTTLIDIATGLLTPTAGTVRVHGEPLDPAAARRWRDRLAYVTQETWLSNDTIRANLLLGREPLDDAALYRALALVGAETLVRTSERGLDTPVNEQGSRFSGGERQRLALARALLRQPELLILDEATNAIDPAAEAAIFADVLAAMPAMTWLVIAHRPSTLAFCRRELRLEAGRLVADRVL